MLNEYSLDALLKFLDYLAEKGLANKDTIASRKASSNKMLSILGIDEQSDLRNVDLDDVAFRFGNKQGTRYTPKSLQVYKSRTRTAITDFLRYKANPASFKADAGSGRVNRSATSEAKSVASKLPVSVNSGTSNTAAPAMRTASFDVPVPLRPNCIVQINGIPVDLSASEARKIANVVTALIGTAEE